MNIQRQFNLKPYNTMALDAVAEYFCEVTSVEEAREAIDYAKRRRSEIVVIGGGSNIIAAPKIAGLVIRVMIPGITKKPLGETGTSTHIVEAGAGENWHQLVNRCLAMESYGLENLSLIPGHCGAAPIQNIGAYGVELADVFYSLDALDIASGELLTLHKTDCQFSYRDSIFKHALRGKTIITALRLRLSSVADMHVEYPALKQALEESNAALSPSRVAQTVCEIRRRKLPDPTKTPNVGSFFKNPVIDVVQAEAIRHRHPGLVSYFAGGGREKLAAAWLIDQLGWKGHWRGNVGVHNQQALVLVNRAKATGEEVLALAGDIARSVKQQFGVELELEPQKIGW